LAGTRIFITISDDMIRVYWGVTYPWYPLLEIFDFRMCFFLIGFRSLRGHCPTREQEGREKMPGEITDSRLA
jgi:hypothetical protein